MKSRNKQKTKHGDNFFETLLFYYPKAKTFPDIDVDPFSKEDVNDFVKCNFLSSDRFCRLKMGVRPLLHIAIDSLDENFVLFLLQQGANPNIVNPAQQSTLEVLLAVLGDKIQCSYDPKNFNSKEIISKKDIDKAEKILDLLICFGLNIHQIKWRPGFLNHFNKIKDDMDYLVSEYTDYHQIITRIRTDPDLPDYKYKSWLKRVLDKLERKYDVSKLEKMHNETTKSDNYKNEWFQSTAKIFETIKISAEEIQADKNKELAAVKKNIEASMNHPNLTFPFISLVMEYAQTEFDVAMKVAELRANNGSKTNFWISTDLDAFDAEKYKNIIVYAEKLRSILPIPDQRLSTTETYSNTLLEMISEYAQDDGLSLSLKL